MAKQQPVPNQAGTHIWMTHEGIEKAWECPRDYVDTALDRGWDYAPDPGPTTSGLFDETTAEGANQTGFDPAEHDVDEVNAHLEKHAATAPGEVDRVLQLERAGRNRKTVVDPRPPADDPQTGADDGAATGD